ncbi:MAG TPA: cation:proton antiporter [Ktedonobacterales bacterium]
MRGLSESQLLLVVVALAVMLALARVMGGLAKRFGQPEVVGELFAGFLLGPSVGGALFPGLSHLLFGDHGVGLVLSGFSWIGAILLLLIAGMEADLAILRAEAKPGALAAFCSIAFSLAAGTLFAWIALARPLRYAFFLGIVLSVTAVSVVAKILIEREVLRRRYAQVMLAAGIASEAVVWLLVAVVSAEQSGSPMAAALRSGAFALIFFVFMIVVGRRFTAWAMRRVADYTTIFKGQLSLVLVLAFLSAGLTQILGLHALLGAFVFGVLLTRAPRTNRPLVEGIQSLTSALFAPIFFVLAGMRVDIFQLSSLWAVGMVAVLLVLATVVKVGFGALGARLGGLSTWESALVGVGLNLKGGTDVIVAIVGVELGLLSPRTYTMYTVVAIITVLVSPPVLAILERKTPPQREEVERLEREEAARRAYVSRVERVLVPIAPQLLSALAADVVRHIAVSKHNQGEIFDISELALDAGDDVEGAAGETQAQTTLSAAGTLRTVEVTRRRAHVSRALAATLDASREHDLIAIGAQPRVDPREHILTYGSLQDAIIHQARTDVLVVASRDARINWPEMRRVLVPTNGMEYSMAAGDIAAHLALPAGAELVLFHAVHPEMDAIFWREQDHRLLRQRAAGVVGELAFRVRRLGVRVSERVEISEDPGGAIVRELERGDYQMVVLGGLDHGAEDRPYLGKTIRAVLTHCAVPAVLLIAHSDSG